ncbi:MAG: hypothetical protein RXR20_25440 [Paraburkholderia sp.]|uniref:hypothetical protein n=1 Tax=Burkholderiaceae TaxID=119060 RepID=UPI0010F9ADAE|nr:hypothetical protein [Burkholderia sp. 4M9327F10]
MENAIYWHGRQVGIECDGQILWFTSAPNEAIDAYSSQPPTAGKPAPGGDSQMARNLLKVAR